MLFAVRDDDVNFFTEPEELEFAYSHVWDKIPPTFSVISHVKGNWNRWAEEIYRLRQNADWKAWQRDNEAYPIDKNTSLIKFLNEGLANRKLDVCFHAIHHRNEDPVPPEPMPNNYVQGAEFYTTRDMRQPLADAIRYLHQHLKTKISVFTPPQNLLSLKGYKAVVSQKLSIIGSGIPFWKKERTLAGLINMTRVAGFKLKQSNKDYPFTLYFKNHSEVIHHYALHPTTKVEYLVEKFETARQLGGNFVLSTHYYEFKTPLVYNKTKNMKYVFDTFIDHVQRYNVDFCTLSEMCSERQGTFKK
jgi:hypothetical protein